MNYTHFVSVAGLVSNDNGEILLIKSPRRGWEYPGGMVEPGETFQEALIREIKEELDTEITVDKFITTVEYDYPEFHLVMDCFWCSIKNGELKLLEHEAARWLPLDDLLQVKWLPADLEVINDINF